VYLRFCAVLSDVYVWTEREMKVWERKDVGREEKEGRKG
jgi:hypothetical protein